MEGSRGAAPFIPNLRTGWRWEVHFTAWPQFARGRTPVPSEQEDGWAAERLWTLIEEKKDLLPLSKFEPRPPDRTDTCKRHRSLTKFVPCRTKLWGPILWNYVGNKRIRWCKKLHDDEHYYWYGYSNKADKSVQRVARLFLCSRQNVFKETFDISVVPFNAGMHLRPVLTNRCCMLLQNKYEAGRGFVLSASVMHIGVLQVREGVLQFRASKLCTLQPMFV
jgi:hypothetical protein